MTAVPKSGEVYYADDGTVSIVLDDNYDPNYEPPQKEIEEYARWLGIDVDAEKDLLFIARDGLKAPLPKEWKPCKTDTGEVYYFNFRTGESIWDHPMDDVYKKRVADERAKRGTSSGGVTNGSLGSNPDLSKKSSMPKLVKGGAGAKQQESSAGATRGRFNTTTFADDVKPKSSRLGALGSTDDGSSKPIRPDISDILPAKTESHSLSSGANLLLGKKKEPLKDTKELERKFREKYQSEFATSRQSLKDNHAKAVDKLREELDSQLRRERQNLQSEMEDELEQTRRAAERRNKRELAIFEESIEKQKEDLRRTLRTLQEKYDADSLGVARRVDSELAEKRNNASKNMAAEISRRRQELQEAWQREKVQAELNTQSTMRDVKAEYDRKVEAAANQEGQQALKRITELEDSLLNEVQQIRMTLQAERHQHTARLQSESNATNAAASMEYAAANADFQRAVEEAKRAAADDCDRIRRDYKNKTAAAQREHEEQKNEAELSNAALQHKSEREAVEARRLAGQQRIAAASQEQSARTAEEMLRYTNETTSLLQQAQERQRLATEQAQKAAADVRAACAQRHADSVRQIEVSHQQRVEALRSEHTSNVASLGLVDVTSMPEFQAQLASAKSRWLTQNPAPVFILPQRAQPAVILPPPVVAAEPHQQPSRSQPATPIIETVNETPSSQQIASIVTSKIASARSQLQAEISEKIQLAKAAAAQENSQYIREYREKAMRDISDRLRAYKQERLASPSRVSRAAPASSAPASPYRHRPVTPPQDLHEKIAQRRDQLQRSLDEEEQQLLSALQRVLAASRASTATSGPAIATVRPQSAEPSRAREEDVFHPPHPLRSSSANVRMLLPTTANKSSEPSVPLPGTIPFDQEAIAALLHAAAAVAASSANNTPSKQKKRQSTIQERIATAHEMLRKKKKELRSRQEQLELARSDWKKDMALAKQQRDSAMQHSLAKVKMALEQEAKQLNKEAIALKESLAYLKVEEERLLLRSSPERQPPRNQAEPHSLPAGNDELQALVVHLLQKTEEMEKRLEVAQRGGQPEHHNHHQTQVLSPRRAESNANRDRVVDKWSTWLRENARSTSTTAMMGANGGGGGPAGELQLTPKQQHVHKWLNEQP